MSRPLLHAVLGVDDSEVTYSLIPGDSMEVGQHKIKVLAIKAVLPNEAEEARTAEFLDAALDAANARLDAIRQVLTADGYFTEADISDDDLAPRIAERLAHSDAELRSRIIEEEGPAFAVMPDYTGLHQASFSYASPGRPRTEVNVTGPAEVVDAVVSAAVMAAREEAEK